MTKISLLASLLLTPALALALAPDVGVPDNPGLNDTRLDARAQTLVDRAKSLKPTKAPVANTKLNKDLVRLYEKPRNAVVFVMSVYPLSSLTDKQKQNLQEKYELTNDELPGAFPYGLPGSLGSGFITKTAKGPMIVTNAHVIEGKVAHKIHIKMWNEPAVYQNVPLASDIVAEVAAVGRSADGIDLAFLKLPPTMKYGTPWPTLELGDSKNIKVGEKVYAFGYPFGIELTLTDGLVSAKDVEAEPYVKFIQTNAAINPGNSGGPLLDAHGKVVGVNTQILSRSGTSSGIGFAIQVDDVKRALAQYEHTGSIGSGRLGVGFGGKGLVSSTVVTKVFEGTPADKAGIKVGDKIFKVDGKVLSDDSSLGVQQIMRAVKAKIPGTDKIPGEMVKITVLRDTEIKTFEMMVIKEVPVPSVDKNKEGDEDQK